MSSTEVSNRATKVNESCAYLTNHILADVRLMCAPQIMVDDVAAIVIMLSPPPATALAPRPAPKKAARARATNAAANSVEAKAERDELSALPYQNFFRHLELVRLARHISPVYS